MQYIYACISDNRMKTMEEVQRTRKYKKALELSKIFNIDNVVIDVCSSWNRKKPNLENILLTPENVIVISDVSALGKQEEVQEVYQRIVNSRNELLICYFNNSGVLTVDDLSTVSVSFEKKKLASLDERLEMMGGITSTQFKADGWRMVDAACIEAYWAYEKGEKSMADILSELEISRNTFLKRVADYIGSDAWVKRINQEGKQCNIEEIPMRIGEVTEDGLKMYQYLLENPDDYPIDSYLSLAEYAGVRKDLFDKWYKLSLSNTEEDQAQANAVRDQLNAIAIHTYRQVLKHKKYLRNKKYRK